MSVVWCRLHPLDLTKVKAAAIMAGNENDETGVIESKQQRYVHKTKMMGLKGLVG